MAEFIQEFKHAWVTLDLNCKGEIASHSWLGVEHSDQNKLLVNYQKGQDRELSKMELEPRRKERWNMESSYSFGAVFGVSEL